MDQTDILIIGAGAVGLAIGRLLSESRDVVVVEKHDSFGRETSSRNSEVIHAGFYYPENSLKAKLCVRGNPLLYEYCAAAEVPHSKVGKVVIGNTEDEIKKIHHLFEQGRKNGVPGLELLDRAQVHELEPNIIGAVGLWSPSTGILDTHTLMKSYVRDAARNGATIAYGCKVCAIQKSTEGYVVGIKDTDDKVFSISATIVVNAAGLWADTIAALAGIDLRKSGYTIHPCKGEYFAVAPRHKGKLSHLVYPAPTAISLGVHGVLSLTGSLKLGPNAFYVDSKEDYSVDPSHHDDFLANARQYLPFIESRDLTPDMSGIRPKLQMGDEAFHDFVICDESARGLPGLINLVGIESPGLTSSLAIAEMVGEIVNALQ